MFSSFFSTSAPVDPNAPTFHSVSTGLGPDELFGKLEPKDTEWLCGGGFITETQTFYVITQDGSFLMCQVIHAAVGVWYPTIQFTLKSYNPKTKEVIFKTISVNNFVTPPPGLDKRSSKADEFSVTYKSTPGSDTPESYTIRANLSQDLQISLELARPKDAPGFKVGNSPKGGYSYFGPNVEEPEGFVVHRFWPLTHATGHVIQNGSASPIEGHGLFSHAIQGMRPNLVASQWKFAYFQSPKQEGVTALQMEFTTLDTYGAKGTGSGPVVVNVGGLVIGGKLAMISAETKWAGENKAAHDGKGRVVKSRAEHLAPAEDVDTGYHQPTAILYEWEGPSLLGDGKESIAATLNVDVGGPHAPRGLMDKVDLLSHIPYVVKMAVNYVAATKPYIYQWLNPATIVITGPDSVIPGLSGGLDVEGTLFSEASFIS